MDVYNITNIFLQTTKKNFQNISEKCILCAFICFGLGDLVTRMGERGIWSVSERLPDNPGELAQMNSVIGRVRYSRSCLNHTFVCSFCRGCS